MYFFGRASSQNHKNNNDNDFIFFGYPNSNLWLRWKVNLVTEQHTSKFSRTLASRPILSVTASRLRLNAKKEKARSVGCSSARLARSGCRGFAPAALAREVSPRRDADRERTPRNSLEIIGNLSKKLDAWPKGRSSLARAAGASPLQPSLARHF